MTSLQTEIARPSANVEAIIKRIAVNPALLAELFAGLEADRARIKFGCLKALRLLSEQQPAVLYSRFEEIVGLLDNGNNILKWGGIIILGNLAAVDSDNRLDALLDRYLQPISGPALITAANTIAGVAKIAAAKPYLVDKVLPALLRVEAANYQTPECRNVALGHVLKALELLFKHIRDRSVVLDFAKRQLGNSRNAVKQRARTFLKRNGGGDWSIRAARPRHVICKPLTKA